MQENQANNIRKMKKEGAPSDDIVNILQDQGNSNQQISEGMNQANTVPEPPAQQAPAGLPGAAQEPPQAPAEQQGQADFLNAMDVPSPEPEQPAMPVVPEVPHANQDFGMNSMQPASQPSPRIMEEEIERITEAIVHEKWQELTRDVGNLAVWKEKVSIDIDSTKQEVLRNEEKVEKLQRAIFGKVEDYNKTLTDVNTEVKALGKVFEKIMAPLTSNIKELQKITKDLKAKK